jgi:hypothetical protein
MCQILITRLELFFTNMKLMMTEVHIPRFYAR